MEGQASISADILARYAADAACEVDGVRGLAGRRGVKVGDDTSVELRIVAEWGASIPLLGRSVQERVREYLARMADIVPPAVEVVVDGIGPAA
jgi:uncharacterized alkaline shock family protein YloU